MTLGELIAQLSQHALRHGTDVPVVIDLEGSHLQIGDIDYTETYPGDEMFEPEMECLTIEAK